ncbi:hypothetical protein MCHIJ_48930 [Mycolicibacterium chitae]|uniref:Secreted protein n=1 Tax=Mycolicibacterium chitae TaxID=1792 RepID=A0A448I9H4_MYCCI|nr:hypothetical protein [Mycolicibacterium chitae]BBZ05456.1 hypothetical protein MCHIJ_48930 [Mycolicibacterium chitae]VEG49072.1 Uncharacterised protein [Mycolicibacterium chitae]
MTTSKFTPRAWRALAGILSTATLGAVLANPAVAWADELVTYEVVSDHIDTANIEYQDATGRLWAVHAPLPWRIDANVRAVRDAPPHGSQVRAHWREKASPGRWVTVRIIYRGEVLCQNTLDLGNAACYGITNRIT